jgi:hypothetical protein|nr:MAG TPA: putative tail-component [Bacteriophage sp.]
MELLTDISFCHIKIIEVYSETPYAKYIEFGGYKEYGETK